MHRDNSVDQTIVVGSIDGMICCIGSAVGCGVGSVVRAVLGIKSIVVTILGI